MLHTIHNIFGWTTSWKFGCLRPNQGYHSQLVERTPAEELAQTPQGRPVVERYREFVTTHSERIYPEYLLAVRRVQEREVHFWKKWSSNVYTCWHWFLNSLWDCGIIPLGISCIKSGSLGSKKPIVLYRRYPPLWGHRGWENDSVQPISGAISNLGVLKMYLSSFVWHDIVLLGGHWFIQMPWPRQFSKNKLGSLILFSKWLLTKKVTKSWFCTGTTWGEMDENLVTTCLWYINLKLPSNDVVVSLLTDCHLKGSRIYTPWLLFEAASLDF